MKSKIVTKFDDDDNDDDDDDDDDVNIWGVPYN